ncbi:ribonucleotide reductase [Auricularia subglabra TFB-10046 SS5]|uniref:Ribonucleotide reductase n=1 Tax=Auricularia subglabra (strain TFB-10046 / SS5) TaxID=717982 RepID=J0CR43_AURST|nr:ribonucleotide reductase [Auricularia subglabra TFB-10046 SS5]
MCWATSGVEPVGDCRDWDENLSDGERDLLAYLLVSVAASKAVDFENLASHFASCVRMEEARCFYGLQLASAGAHMETFSRFARAFIKGAASRAFYFNAIANVPFVRRKAQWVMRWVDAQDPPFRVRLVAFLAAKAIFYSGTFFCLSWFDERGILPALCHASELVARDESVGIDFACRLLRLLGVRPCHHVVRRIVLDAVNIEKEFLKELVGASGFAFDADRMGLYVEYVADRLLEAMGYQAEFSTPNPWTFGSLRPLRGSAGFFERVDMM